MPSGIGPGHIGTFAHRREPPRAWSVRVGQAAANVYRAGREAVRAAMLLYCGQPGYRIGMDGDDIACERTRENWGGPIPGAAPAAYGCGASFT